MNAEAIRLRIAGGETKEQIASAEGVSVRRIGLILGPAREKPRADEERMKDIRARYARGESLRQIAAAVAMSRGKVSAILGDAVQRPKNEPFSAEEIAHIRRRLAAKHDATTIAHEMKRSLAGVRGVMERLEHEDPIRDQIIERLAALGITTGYAVAAGTDGAISVDFAHAFLRREKSMSSRLLWHMLKLAQMELVPARTAQ